MQTTLKKTIIGAVSAFLIYGLTFSIGSIEQSEFEVQGLTNFTSTIKKYNSTLYSSSVSDGNLVVGTASNNISISNDGSATFTVSYAKNTSTTTSIYNNSSGEIRLYGATGGNGGQLTYSVNSGYLITKIIITHGSTNGGISVNGGSTISTTNNTSTTTFGTSITSVVIKNVANGTTRTDLKQVELTYTSTSESDAETFSNTFLTTTENKATSCNADGLSWASLNSTYDGLSSSAKSDFVSNLLNGTIVNARERYIYLRQIDPTLNNFASL